MTDRVAAVLAGIPARIINDVLDNVREAMPDVLVVRGRGARSYSNRLASYPPEYNAEVIDRAVDAIFGQSGRPVGFCRNPQRACLKSDWKKSNCGADDGHACGRTKPERFVVFIQESDEENTNRIIDSFRNTAFFYVIPREAYDHVGRTSNFIKESLRGLGDDLAVSEANIKSGAPALLLPVKNFGLRDLKRLVKRAATTPVPKRSLKAFRAEFFKENSYFLGRSKLAFQPTVEATAHGTPDKDGEQVASIAAHFRAGCRFDDFHWDVSPTGDKGWGATKINCWKTGEHSPSDASHLNVLVDDRVR